MTNDTKTDRRTELALAEAQRAYSLRRRGQIVLASQHERTVNDLVGYRDEQMRWRLPVEVKRILETGQA